MDSLTVAVADLEVAGDPKDVGMDVISSKMHPLKTNKQRNTSNNHRKSKQRSDVNSTDDEEHHHNKIEYNVPAAEPSAPIPQDDDVQRSCEIDGDNENETTTNNDELNEELGFIDSDNENITDRLCSLSKLSIHGGVGIVPVNRGASVSVECAGPVNNPSAGCGSSGHSNSIQQSNPVTISTKRNVSCPSFPESADSFTDVKFTNLIQQSSTTTSGYLPTTGDCASGPGVGDMDPTEKRFRRRRRRRGHNKNSKRMAVDASSPDHTNCVSGGACESKRSYSIRPAGCSSTSSSKKLFKDLNAKIKGHSTASGGGGELDSFGMKRKRTIVPSVENADSINSLHDDLEMDGGDINLNSPRAEMIADEEMKSDNEYSSSFESADDDDPAEDDRGREADDEQSDWVFDEWSTDSKRMDESALSRKKRLLKMLRSYNSMITANAAGGSGLLIKDSSNSSQLQSREIRAGKRRVLVNKASFPSKGIWTSANEEVSKFLQDPLQSQIRLQPISVEEHVQLGHLASLYSLRMDLNPEESLPKTPTIVATESIHDDEDISAELCGVKLCPVLTKTPNTTQMDKNQEPTASASSPFNNGEGSSSSNVSSVYCPTYSDVDSKTSDSKRIKK